MSALIERSWVLLVGAIIFTLLGLTVAVLIPEPSGMRWLILSAASAVVTWILWGQVALTRIRRLDRECADANLKLILGITPQGRRTTIR